jgi:cytochrome c biogenesis protein CcmG, thiol:disulfide interchange protein DsbE
MKRFPVLLSVTVLALALGVVTCSRKSSTETSAMSSMGAKGASATSKDAPDVTFKDSQDHEVQFASLKGKVVLVNFWATWCEPCQMEIPWLIGFQQKYGSKGFTVLGVAMDDDGAKVVAPFVQEKLWDVDGTKMKMTYPIVIGTDDIAQKFGGLLGLPTSVLVSRDGKMVKRILGLITPAELDKEIQGQLQ